MERIIEIDMLHELKCQGIIVNDKTQCFKRHKEEKIKQPRKMENMTYLVMHKSCNKIMIGKVYWKSVVLPSVFLGASLICWTKLEMEVLQRIKNGVWRTMLGAPGYAHFHTAE